MADFAVAFSQIKLFHSVNRKVLVFTLSACKMKCQTFHKELTNQLFNIIKGRNSIILFYEEI